MNEERKGLKEKITNSDIWKSIFRHGYEKTGRRYTLQVLQNVWLHLHPPRISRHALNFRFTWCMGRNHLSDVPCDCCHWCPLDVLLPPGSRICFP